MTEFLGVLVRLLAKCVVKVTNRQSRLSDWLYAWCNLEEGQPGLCDEHHTCNGQRHDLMRAATVGEPGPVFSTWHLGQMVTLRLILEHQHAPVWYCCKRTEKQIATGPRCR